MYTMCERVSYHAKVNFADALLCSTQFFFFNFLLKTHHESKYYKVREGPHKFEISNDLSILLLWAAIVIRSIIINHSDYISSVHS